MLDLASWGETLVAREGNYDMTQQDSARPRAHEHIAATQALESWLRTHWIPEHFRPGTVQSVDLAWRSDETWDVSLTLADGRRAMGTLVNTTAFHADGTSASQPAVMMDAITAPQVTVKVRSAPTLAPRNDRRPGTSTGDQRAAISREPRAPHGSPHQKPQS